MKKASLQTIIIPLMLLMCLVMSCADQAKLTVEQVAADKAAITGYIDTYTKTVNAADLNGWMELWADGARRMEPDSPAQIGKEQIMASMKAFLDTYAITLNIKNEEITVAGDWGYISGTFSYTAIIKAVSDTMNIGGSYLSVMQRQL